MHSDYAQRKSALVHFFGILGYDVRRKRWRAPNTYTPILAGVQFCMCVLILEYALPSDRRDELICTEGNDPLEIFRAVRNKWLVDGEASPFNAMHKLLQYGMRMGCVWDRLPVDETGYCGRKRKQCIDDHCTWKGSVNSLIPSSTERVMCGTLLFGDTKLLAMMNLSTLRDIPNMKPSFISMDDGREWSGGRTGESVVVIKEFIVVEEDVEEGRGMSCCRLHQGSLIMNRWWRDFWSIS